MTQLIPSPQITSPAPSIPNYSSVGHGRHSPRTRWILLNRGNVVQSPRRAPVPTQGTLTVSMHQGTVCTVPLPHSPAHPTPPGDPWQPPVPRTHTPAAPLPPPPQGPLLDAPLPAEVPQCGPCPSRPAAALPVRACVRDGQPKGEGAEALLPSSWDWFPSAPPPRTRHDLTAPRSSHVGKCFSSFGPPLTALEICVPPPLQRTVRRCTPDGGSGGRDRRLGSGTPHDITVYSNCVM